MRAQIRRQPQRADAVLQAPPPAPPVDPLAVGLALAVVRHPKTVPSIQTPLAVVPQLTDPVELAAGAVAHAVDPAALVGLDALGTVVEERALAVVAAVVEAATVARVRFFRITRPLVKLNALAMRRAVRVGRALVVFFGGVPARAASPRFVGRLSAPREYVRPASSRNASRAAPFATSSGMRPL